jgi:hypothetical protein
MVAESPDSLHTRRPPSKSGQPRQSGLSGDLCRTDFPALSEGCPKKTENLIIRQELHVERELAPRRISAYLARLFAFASRFAQRLSF